MPSFVREMEFRKKSNHILIEVGARPSPLSIAQVKEVRILLQLQYPDIEFSTHLISTTGDQDQITSLRILEKTDFFTREIDRWVLEKKGRVGIHSAKDLPQVMAKGLILFCLTTGIDSSDSLVLLPEAQFETLPVGARIGTSSERRENRIREIRDDFVFCDIRGTIEQRLAKLYAGELEGVVIAEAALLRLGLHHLNRIRLSGVTVEGQGKLAVVGHEDDTALQHLFFSIDGRKND